MNESTTIVLPELPLGKDFEDYISAYLYTAGYYLDRNIIDRGVEEILELDVILTDYDNIPRPRLIEIKSAGWGFSEVFKVKGWMAYTRIQKGYFIVQDTRKNFEYYQSKAKEFKVHLLAVPDLKNTPTHLKSLLKGKEPDPRDIETWRYAFLLERNLLNTLKSWKKSHKEKQCFEALEHYYFNINSGVFFTPNFIDRIQKLYDNFQKHGRITAKCGHEMTGGNFDDNHNQLPYEVFSKSFFNCEFNVVQVSTFLEYLSKLAILKNTIDYLLLKNSKYNKNTEIEIDYFAGLTKLDFLPNSFNAGINEISKHKCFNRYAVFWQWFVFVFGGFVMLDFKDKEYALLSEKTGVAVEEIDNALSVMDILFPMNGSWLKANATSNIYGLIFFPMPFRGVGANYRKLMYSGNEFDEGSYHRMNITNEFCFKDLVKWNNLAVEVLAKK